MMIALQEMMEVRQGHQDLLLALIQQRAKLKKVMVHNSATVNLAESMDMKLMKRQAYLPLQSYGQKNIFIAENNPALCSHSFNSNVFCENLSIGPSFTPSFLNSKTSNASDLYKKNKKKKISYTSSYENSFEYRTLIQMFSSGVRLHELNSIATILSSLLSGVKEPNRDTKRSLPLLIQWFHDNWDQISPILPCIQLRDENNQVIDGKREIYEKSLQNK